MVKALKKIWRFIISPYKSRYNLVVILGLIIRTFCIPYIVPDFFELLFESLISMFGLPEIASRIIVRFLLIVVDFIGFNQIFYYLSFWSVGVNYGSGKNPAWGSLCYTIYYLLYSIIAVILVQNLLLPAILPTVTANNVAVVITIVAYTLWVLFSAFISYKLDAFPSFWPAKALLFVLLYLLILFLILCVLIGPPWQ